MNTKRRIEEKQKIKQAKLSGTNNAHLGILLPGMAKSTGSESKGCATMQYRYE
jgi:hypothetical protein